ncbi:hypothetical protein B0H11DRAFT_2279883 [Mycena galericulata]|nr:hypothetical protein B0H11DRAFT_2279883 [Mycena galericulata]
MAPKKGRGGAASAPKRPLPVDSDYEDSSSPTAQSQKRKKKAADKPKPAIEPRAPSTRATRGINPRRAVDKKKQNRPHEVVQAEKDQKTQTIIDHARKRGEDVAMVAAIDAEADEAAAQEEEGAIMTLDDLPASDTDTAAMDLDVVLEIDESDFQRIEDEDAYRSAGEFDEPKKAKAPAASKKGKAKIPKGQTRKEVEAMAKMLVKKKKGAVEASVMKKPIQNKDAAAASKKAGLSASFLSTSSKISQVAHVPQSPKLGGLTDDDAISARPDLDKTKPAGRRSNEVVTIEDSSDLEETPTQLVPPPARAVQKSRKEPKVKTEGKLPALSFGKTPRAKSGVKVETTSSDVFTPGTAADVKGLPALVGPSWDSEYLPAAYRALYCSPQVMTFATMGESASSKEEAVKAVQNILDSVHPGNTLVIEWGDKICARTVSRIRERRSLIAQTALEVVDELFQTSEYRDQPIAIRAYAGYASRFDGPAFWKVPTPENCPANPKAKGYIKGKQYLESPLIIKTVTQFLKNEHFSMPAPEADGTSDFSGMPIGLFAIAAAGIERALGLYKPTGVRPVAIPKFTKAAVGTAVAGYTSNITRFTASRWDSLLTAAGASATDDDGPSTAAEAAAILDGFRDSMYVPSSP